MFNTIPDNSKPIFGSYSHQDPNFNENMDEYVKSANDIYVEEQKKKALQNAQNFAPKRNVNSDAINDIPELPDFLYEQY